MNLNLLTQSELKTYYTNVWCKEKGITAKDLGQHPQADDVVLLVKWREEMWIKLTKKEQGAWAAFWSWTYHNKYPLKRKHLIKLEKITLEAVDRHLKNSIIQSQQRQKIRQLRSVI
jgi:hypothetical protein